MEKNLFIHIILILLFVNACKQESSTKKNHLSLQEDSNKLQKLSKEKRIDGMPLYLYNKEARRKMEEERNRRYQSAYQAQQSLYQSFEKDYPQTAYCDYYGITHYLPDYYGGSYLDNQQNLVLFIIGDSLQYRKELERRLRRNDFSIRQAQYSYKRLLQLRDSIINVLAHNPTYTPPYKRPLFSASIEEDENKIVIWFSRDSADIALFKEEVIDSAVLLFKKSEDGQD